MRRQLDGARAAQRASDALIKTLQDRLFETEQTLTALKNELADREEDCNVLNKKFITLKNAQAAAAAAAPGALCLFAVVSGCEPGMFKAVYWQGMMWEGPCMHLVSAIRGACRASLATVPRAAPSLLMPVTSNRAPSAEQLADILCSFRPTAAPAMASVGPGPAAGASVDTTSSSAAAAAAGAAAGSEAADAAAEELQELHIELAALRAALEARRAELDAEREAHAAAKRELASALAKARDEPWVAQTAAYQALQRSCEAAKAECERRQWAVEAALRERDEARAEAEAQRAALVRGSLAH